MTDYKSWKRDELYELASDMDIEGRSSMNKRQLILAIQKAEGPDNPPSDPGHSDESADSKPSKALLARRAVEESRAALLHARLSHEAARSQVLLGGDPTRLEAATSALTAAEKAYTKARANAR